MEASLLLYLLLNGLATASCWWALATALPRVAEHGAAHRAWTVAAGLLLPPLVLLAWRAETHGPSELRVLAVCLGPLALAAAWSSVMTLRDQAWWLKGLHLPVLAWNSVLAGAYSARTLQDLAGLELGLPGAVLTAAHAQLQTLLGGADAATNPCWFSVPFVLPLRLRFGAAQRAALVAWSAASLGLVGLLGAQMPAVFARVASWRAPAAPAPILTCALGAKVDPTQAPPAWAEDLLQLGVDHLTVDVTPDLVADELRVADLQAQLHRARLLGLQVVVITKPAAAFERIPARDLSELQFAMARTQWLAAERLRPDLLVLFAGPFGRLARCTALPPSLDAWLATIQRSATEARQANPAIRLGVAVDGRGPHTAELFRSLLAPSSPVDVVGLSLAPGGATRAELQALLGTYARWCARLPGAKAVRVLEAGACPQRLGGETAQVRFLLDVVGFAALVDGMEAVTIDALYDGRDKVGLITADGRGRPGYAELAQLARRRPANPR
jgi:hypothetical protein